jgi:hypothetical protein
MKTQVAPQATGANAYVDEYWDNLTDAELLSIPWYIDDPRTLSNIQDIIPDDLGEFQVEIEYKRDPADSPVRCAHCPHHTQHWHGFVLKAADGRRFLLGSHCGPKAYGADYRIASNARSRKKQRYEALTKWLRVRNALPDIADALAELEQDASFKAVRRARAKLHHFAPSLLGRLHQISPESLTQSRHLHVAYSERDTADEQRRQVDFEAAVLAIVDLPNKQHRLAIEELRQRFRPGQPTMVQVQRDLGALPPLDWLLAGNPPDRVVSDVAARLRGYVAVSQKTENVPTTMIQRWTRDAKADVALAVTAIQRIRTSERFFASENLHRIAEWDARYPKGALGVSAVGGTLVAKGEAIALIHGWRPPGDQFLELAADIAP